MPTTTATVTVTGHGGSAKVTASCLVGAAALVGATVAPVTYSMPNTQGVAAAQQFDGYVGQPLAVSLQRQYLSEGNWSLPSMVTSLAAVGCKTQLCVKPSRVLAASEQANLAACIKAMQALGAPFEITLWTEMNMGGSTPFFPSAGVDYPAYWSYYAPVILDAGATLNFNPGTDAADYGKGITYGQELSPAPSRLYCDYYGNGWKNGTRLDSPPSGVPMSFMALADSLGVPFGIAELGGGANGAAMLSSADWTSFMNYIHTLFWTRLEAGKANADLIIYASGAGGEDNPANVITSATDIKTGNESGIPGYSQTYGQLSEAVLGS